MSDEKAVGGTLVVLGALALAEARRLVALRTEMLAGAVVGDDTFPLLVGAGLIAVGVYLLAARRRSATRPTFPSGSLRTRMLLGALTLVAYCALVPYAGYSAATAVAALALFRTIGAYGWATAAVLAGATTGVLYVVFVGWLRQPLPGGLLGF